ncbi:MAG: alpha-L-fucosidase [Anaerolineae bacterium]|nr:alpha-L-fucosidase [Anaerolineae bacterium]
MHFEPTWESLAQFTIPAWYQDAKFGIFIHWGLYSVPAFDNEWYPRNMYIPGSRAFEHHRQRWGDHRVFGLKDFIPLFKAERFDPARWVDLFKRAGAKYVVPVAEHHDGFAMYDSALTRWNAAQMGPKRDIIGDLAKAARQAGLVFGLSSHRAEHWWFLNGGRTFDSDVQSPSYEDFYGPAQPSPDWGTPEYDGNDWNPRPNAKFLEDWLARSCELVDKYQPNLIYFDWWIYQIVFAPYLQRFAAHYYNRAQSYPLGGAINCKNEAFPEGTAVFGVERGQLNHIRSTLWQGDTSVAKNSWGYTTELDYKTTSSLLHNLIDMVSKNGTMLLNICPRADGTIPEAEERMLLEIGHWLAVNGEAIYGSRPWKVFGEGPTEVVSGAFQEVKRTPFTGQDIRFTTQGETLYAILLGWPKDGTVTIQSLGLSSGLYPRPISRMELLGSDAPVQCEREVEGLRVILPKGDQGHPAYALRIVG